MCYGHQIVHVPIVSCPMTVFHHSFPRCWLSENSELAPEAVREVTAVQKMSDANIRMHELLEEAMKQNKVAGALLLIFGRLS